MLRVAIVEDEPAYAGELAELLDRYQKERDISLQVSRFQDGEEFLSSYSSNQDIIFMDIEMPHMDGMRAAAELRRIDTNVCLIFVTNMAQYAVKGYEVEAMDFLVKPLTYPVLAYKLDKAVALAHKRQGDNVVLKTKNGMIRLRASEIRFVEVIQHHVIYHTERETMEARSSLSQVEALLKPHGFSRCNACYLVNLRNVDKVEDHTVFLGGERLEISRGKKAQFLQDLMHFLGA